MKTTASKLVIATGLILAAFAPAAQAADELGGGAGASISVTAMTLNNRAAHISQTHHTSTSVAPNRYQVARDAI